mgnify:CR=1 FL=1
MQIVILGNGNMGRPLTALAEGAGHSVTSFGSARDPLPALATADLVILAMKYEQALAFAERPGVAEALKGKVVIDITNPLSPDFMSLTVGHTNSAGEEIARRLPGARVVKAFNTLFAAVLAKRVEGSPVDIPVFVAGDDEAAVRTVTDLVGSFGLEAVKSGPLANARYLEPMTEMMIHLGYALGHGDRIGFGLLRV